MDGGEALAHNTKELRELLIDRGDFKNFAHDVSEATLFALERRHLEYLDLSQVPRPDLQPFDYREDLSFLRLERIGHSPAIERSLDILNMQNILGTFRGCSHSLVAAICSDGVRVQFYLGARRTREGAVAADFIKNLERAIEGNLPGTRLRSCGRQEVEHRIIRPIHADYAHLAALPGIPSLRGGRDEQFAQSLDRLVQALQGQQYMLLIIAEPLEEMIVNEILSNCLRLGSSVHSWVRVTAGYAQAHGVSTATAEAHNKMTGGAENTGRQRNVQSGSNRQPGIAVGGVLGAAVSLGLSSIIGPAAIGIGSVAGSVATGVGGGVNRGISEGETTSRSRTWGESVTQSLTESSNTNETASINVEYLNKTAEYCEHIIDGYIRRLQRGKNLGMWNAGVYFLADDTATFAQGQAQLRSLYSGSETHHEPMRALDLSGKRLRRSIGAVLGAFTNPVLELQDPVTHEPMRHPLGQQHCSLSTPLNTEELALLMNLPRREAPGLELQMVADFGVNPVPYVSGQAVALGNVVSGGRELELPVGIPLAEINRHLFVTGMTGTGKTNTCFAIMKSLGRNRIPFLVIEPAKGEYRNLHREDEICGPHIYTLGDERVSPFRINPFQFVPGMNLVTHVDNLKAIFNAAFSMYASMPYMLEEAILKCYEDYGWDLVNSSNRFLGSRLDEIVKSWERGQPDYGYALYLPTLSDLLVKVDEVVNSKGYAEEARQNYGAALRARIKSLINKGPMLNTRRGVPYEALFGPPGPPEQSGVVSPSVVLEMRSMGDDADKCFVMALLLAQLYEYREQTYRWHPQEGLRHVTVLEEAHRLLGRSAPGGMETADPRGKAIEAFANMLAEIREYGEGLLIVDQSPARLIPDVLKNTGTKVMHSVKARDDCDAMGDTMNMNDEQRLMVSLLGKGHAIFQTQDQDKPLWIKVGQMKGGDRRAVRDQEVKAAMSAIQEQHRQEERQLAEQQLGRVLQNGKSLLSDRVRALTDALNEPHG
jgi:hypothetical protein